MPTATPLASWLERARPLNPGVSDADLTSYYEQEHPATPSGEFEDWLTRAKPLNPSATDDDLKSYWQREYGSRGATEHEPKDFVGRGAVIAGKQIPQLAYGVEMLAGQALKKAGAESLGDTLTEHGAKGYQKKSEEIAKLSLPTDDVMVSWDKARNGDPGALASFLKYGIEYGGMQALEVLATGGLGAVAGRLGLEQVAKLTAEKMIQRETAALAASKAAAGKSADELTRMATANVAGRIGQTTAIAGQALGMEAGEIGGDVVSRAKAEGRDLTGEELAKAFGASVAAGSLEFVGDKLGLDLLVGKAKLPGTMGRLARAGGTGAALGTTEALTEASQSVIEQAGEGRDPFSEEGVRDIINSAALGGVAGGAIGGVSGLVNQPIQATAPAKPPKSQEDYLLESERRVEQGRTELQQEAGKVPPEQKAAINILAAPTTDEAILAAERAVEAPNTATVDTTATTPPAGPVQPEAPQMVAPPVAQDVAIGHIVQPEPSQAGSQGDLAQQAEPGLPVAPVSFRGIQPGIDDLPPVALWTATQDMPPTEAYPAGVPRGSTVSAETLSKAGFQAPPLPQEGQRQMERLRLEGQRARRSEPLDSIEGGNALGVKDLGLRATIPHVEPLKPSPVPRVNGEEFKAVETGDIVDGRTVLGDIPNMGSIGSSLDDYEVLDGVREVPFSAFTQLPKLSYYSATEASRTKDLAERIRQSGEIKPLIVVMDEEGPYILEGGHRFDALRELNARSFPALVVRNLDSIRKLQPSPVLPIGPPQVVKEPKSPISVPTQEPSQPSSMPLVASAPAVAPSERTPVQARAPVSGTAYHPAVQRWLETRPPAMRAYFETKAKGFVPDALLPIGGVKMPVRVKEWLDKTTAMVETAARDTVVIREAPIKFAKLPGAKGIPKYSRPAPAPKVESADVVRLPRHELPDAQNVNLEERADIAADLMASGEPGKRVFTDNPEGPGNIVTGIPSTYPKWYGPLAISADSKKSKNPKTKREKVIEALEKIKRDKGEDVGPTVEKVKDAIMTDEDLDALVGEFPGLEEALAEQEREGTPYAQIRGKNPGQTSLLGDEPEPAEKPNTRTAQTPNTQAALPMDIPVEVGQQPIIGREATREEAPLFSKEAQTEEPRQSEVFAEEVSRDSPSAAIATALREAAEKIEQAVKPKAERTTPFAQPSGPAPTFYSQAERVISQKMPNRASAEQVKAILSPNNGVKPDEIKWLGVDDFITTKDTFTKQDVLDYLQANQVEIVEVMHTQEPTTVDEARLRARRGEILEQLPRLGYSVEEDPGGYPGEVLVTDLKSDEAVEPNDLEDENPQAFRLVSEYADIALAFSEEGVKETGTKFQKYQIPGGTNYRELLLTLPTTKRALTPAERSEMTNLGLRGKLTTEQMARYDELNRIEMSPRTDFTSSHFPEKNILVHIRFNTRMVNGKKVLFLEEVQSDLHQQGRRKGYKGEPLTADEKRRYEALLEDGRRNLTGDDLAEFERLIEKRNAYDAGVPDMPFKKTWHELALRKMLRYASEHGYDAISWTPGEIQNDRYDLSKQIDDIIYRKDGEDNYYIGARKDGKRVLSENMTAAKLADTVGKDVADKIVNGVGEDYEVGGVPGKRLSGLDLKVGGSGMIGWYGSPALDKRGMIGDYLAKYGKKWGAAVGTMELAEEHGAGATFEREQDGTTYFFAPHSNVLQAAPTLTAGGYDANAAMNVDDFEEPLPQATRDEIVQRLRGELPSGKKSAPTTITVHSLPITPSMRASVLTEGQPFFQLSPGQALAAVKAYKPAESVTKAGDHFRYTTIQGTDHPATYPTQAEALEAAERHQSDRLDEISNHAFQRMLHREHGLDVAPLPRDATRLKLKKALRELDAQTIDRDTFIQRMDDLYSSLELKHLEKAYNEKARLRGPAIIRERLMMAVRRGDVPREQLDLAEWFLKGNEHLFDSLAISVRTPTLQRSGEYNPLARLMVLMKGTARTDTAVHEMLHHLERLMPQEFQSAIRKEWTTQLAKARTGAAGHVKDYLEAVLLANATNKVEDWEAAQAFINDGSVPYDLYHLMNASEFWAVNASGILQARKTGIWGRIFQWMKEAVERIKGALGLTSEAPLLKALSWLQAESTGKELSSKMLGEAKAYADVAGDDAATKLAALNAQLLKREGIVDAFRLSTAGDQGVIHAFKQAFNVTVIPIAANVPEARGFLAFQFRDRMFVDAEDDRVGFIQLAGHELLHQLRRDQPGLYDWLADQARDYLQSGADRDYLQRLKATGTDLHGTDVREEILADFVGDSLADPNFLQHLAERNASKFRLFVQAVLKWLRSLMQAMTDKGLGSSVYVQDVQGLQGYLGAVLDAYRHDEDAIADVEPPQYARAMSGPRSPALQKWFANSKVVNPDGSPKVVYHGTATQGLESFDPSRAGSIQTSDWGKGIYFTTSRNSADYYREEAVKRTDKRDAELYAEYEQEAKRLGTTPMNSTIDLGYDSPNAIRLKEFADRWLEHRRALDRDKSVGDVVPVYLKIENPLIYQWEGMTDPFLHEHAMGKGHDGIFIVGRMPPAGEPLLDYVQEIVAFSPTQIKSATGNRGTYDATNPSIFAQLSPAVRGLDRMGPITEAQQAALQHIHGTPETWKEKLSSFATDWQQTLIQGIFDQYAPILGLSKKGYMLARQAKGGDGTLEALLLYGKPYVDADGAYRVDYTKAGGMNGFAKVLAKLHGEGDRFLEWVAAQRAERLKGIGLENLYSDADISALKTLNQGDMANGDSRQAVYAQALLDLNEWNAAMVKIAVDSGLIDAETAKLYKDTPYVPFYRLQEEGVTGFGMKAGLVNQYAWKKLKGGTAHLHDDLLANLLQNWSHLITASAKNRAAKVTLEAAVQAGIAHEVPSGSPGKGLVGFRDNVRRTKTEKIVAMRDGDEVEIDLTSSDTANIDRVFVVDDPALLDAVAALHYAGLGSVGKPFITAKRWLTTAVTVNPAFKIRNLIRDSIQAIGTAELSYNPLGNIAQGFKATEKDSETRAQLLAGGGMIRFGSMLDGNNADRTRRLIESGADPDTILDSDSKLKNLWRQKLLPAFEAYQELGDRGEQISRAALYEQLMAKGMSHQEASFWARDLLDFSLSGKWEAVRILAQIVPFMNARLQGIYKLGRATKADYRRMGTTLGAVALSSMALMLAYQDDDDWKKREDWDRDNFWWFKIGDLAFRLPKPFEIGALGTLAERGLEYFVSDEMTGERFGRRMSAIVFSQLSMDPTPQLVRPLMGLYANKDPFTDRPIETMGMERLRKEDRISTRTSEIAKVLGSLGLPDPTKLAMGRWDTLSPVQVDYLVRGYLSWVGSSATAALDYGMRPLMDRGERPNMTLKDVFLAGNFVESLPTGSSRYVTQLYEQAAEIEQAYGSYRDALKRGDKDDAKAILEEERDKIRQYPKVERIKLQERELNAQIRRIEASKILTGEQKRERIDRLQDRKNQIAQRLAR